MKMRILWNLSSSTVILSHINFLIPCILVLKPMIFEYYFLISSSPLISILSLWLLQKLSAAYWLNISELAGFVCALNPTITQYCRQHWASSPQGYLHLGVFPQSSKSMKRPCSNIFSSLKAPEISQFSHILLIWHLLHFSLWLPLLIPLQ